MHIFLLHQTLIYSFDIYSPIVSSVYPIQMYILKNAHSPTLRPKGTQTPTKLHISLLAEYNPPIVGSIYPIPNYIHPSWQNIIPQLLTAYIQYQYINSNGIYSPIVCSIYPIKCIFPKSAPEDRPDTPQPGCYKLRDRATAFVVKSVLSQFMRFWVYHSWWWR